MKVFEGTIMLRRGLCFLITLVFSAMISFSFVTDFAFAESGSQGGLTAGGVIRKTPDVETADSDELLEKYFDLKVDNALGKSKYSSSKKSFAKIPRRSKLNHIEQYLYDEILVRMEEAASGKTSSTEFDIDLSEQLAEYLVDSDGYKAITSDSLGISGSVYKNGGLSDEAVAKLFDTDKVVDALLFDNPYPAYWFDKVSGYYTKLNCLIEAGASESDIYFEEAPCLSTGFIVAEGYRASDGGGDARFHIDKEKAGATASAVTTVEPIVKDNSTGNDLEKLYAYKDTICALTSYNYDAAGDADVPYGDPWQLIWVFDGDDSTSVVCEGYAKAFQYLCDKSSFENKSIGCRIVTGFLDYGTGSGNHMWNILHMDDGKNYIADITNCDADDSEGGAYPEDVFLKGYFDITNNGGYVYSGDSKYEYDADTLSQYSEAELAMSASDYGTEGTANKVIGITFRPVNDSVKLAEGVNGHYERGVFIYELAFAKGDSIDVRYSGTNTLTTYVYETDRNGFGEFRAQGSVPYGAPGLIADTDILQQTNQNAGSAWTVGNSYEIKLSYLNCTYTLPVTIVCGHNDRVHIDRTEPNCINDGTEAHYECTKCGCLLTKKGVEYIETTADALKIPATGIHTWGNNVYTWNADFTEVTGMHTCIICGKSVTAKAKRASEKVTKPATYDENGEIIYTSEAFAEEGFEVQRVRVVTDKKQESDPTKVGQTVKKSGNTYKVTSVKSNTVAFTNAKNAKNITIPAIVKLGDGKNYKVTAINANAFKGKNIRNVVIGKNVIKIAKNAFKGSRAATITVKTKLLKKAGVKGSLKGSKVKTVVIKVGSKTVNKKFVKSYKKIFTKTNAGKKVTVK